MLNLACFPLPPSQKQRWDVQGAVMDAGELGLTHSGPTGAIFPLSKVRWSRGSSPKAHQSQHPAPSHTASSFPLSHLSSASPAGHEEFPGCPAALQEPSPAWSSTCSPSSSSTTAPAHLQHFKGKPWDEPFKKPLHGAAARSWLQLWMLDINNNSKHNN